jgi:hypothetical protein
MADFIVYSMLAGIIGGLIYLCIAVPKRFAALGKARQEFLDWAVLKAAEIATHQQWVSPYRLINQMNMTKSDAQEILRIACARGVLYQAVNGRFYVKNR